MGGLHRNQALVLPAKAAVVAVDVLDDDDRAVDQQSQRQDQREERDAVDGQAGQVGGAQGQGQDQRHRYAHDQRLLQAQERGGHQEDGQDRDAQVLDQTGHCGIRLLAVVARDDQFNARWHELRLHALDATEHVVGDEDRVGAGLLGHRQRDGRDLRLLSLAEASVRRPEGEAADPVALVGRTVDDLRHIAQVDGAAGVAADDQAPEVLRRGQEAVQEHLAVLPLLDHSAQRRGDIAGAQGGAHLVQRDTEGLQALRVQFDAQLAIAPALDGHGGHRLHAAQPLHQAVGQAL